VSARQHSLVQARSHRVPFVSGDSALLLPSWLMNSSRDISHHRSRSPVAMCSAAKPRPPATHWGTAARSFGLSDAAPRAAVLRFRCLHYACSRLSVRSASRYPGRSGSPDKPFVDHHLERRSAACVPRLLLLDDLHPRVRPALLRPPHSRRSTPPRLHWPPSARQLLLSALTCRADAHHRPRLRVFDLMFDSPWRSSLHGLC